MDQHPTVHHRPTDQQSTISSTKTAVSSNTPTAHTRTLRASYQTDTHEKRKDAVCHDVAAVTREIPHDRFIQTLLPTLRDGINIHEVLRKLSDQGTIKDGRLAAFKVKPSKIDDHEDSVFKDELETLVRDIVQAAKTDDIVPTLEFVHSGKTTPESKFTSNDTRPDSFAILLTCIGMVMWAFLGLIGEVKKTDSPKSRHDVRLFFRSRSLLIDSISRTTGNYCGVCTLPYVMTHERGSDTALLSKIPLCDYGYVFVSRSSPPLRSTS